jgi:hypothetical protein
MARTKAARKERLETISSDFAPVTLAQLLLASDTRGAAVRDGRVTDLDALAYIGWSNERLAAHPCHRWLASLKVQDVPRLLDTRTPYPLFPPRVRGPVGNLVFRVLGVPDIASWISVACYPTDPLRKLPGRVFVADEIDIVTALAASGLTYHAFETRRRTDDLLQAAILQVGSGAIRYDTRAFLHWLHHRGFAAVEPA